MSAPKTSTVIGIICAGDLAVHRAEIKAAIARGITENPDAVWVCIEPRSDRMTHDLMISLDIEPVVLPMNKAWQHKPVEFSPDGTVAQKVVNNTQGSGVSLDTSSARANSEATPPLTDRDSSPERRPTISYDLRRLWRDLEMLHLCDQLIVFQKAKGHSPWRDRAESGRYNHRLYLVEIGHAKTTR